MRFFFLEWLGNTLGKLGNKLLYLFLDFTHFHVDLHNVELFVLLKIMFVQTVQVLLLWRIYVGFSHLFLFRRLASLQFLTCLLTPLKLVLAALAQWLLGRVPFDFELSLLLVEIALGIGMVHAGSRPQNRPFCLDNGFWIALDDALIVHVEVGVDGCDWQLGVRNSLVTRVGRQEAVFWSCLFIFNFWFFRNESLASLFLQFFKLVLAC